jgi:hypothetical protein
LFEFNPSEITVPINLGNLTEKNAVFSVGQALARVKTIPNQSAESQQ